MTQNYENIRNRQEKKQSLTTKSAITACITTICQYWQLLVVRLVLVALNICLYWHFLIQEYL